MCLEACLRYQTIGGGSLCICLDLPAVLISSGCCNKIPPTGWLKTTEIYSLAVGRTQSPRSRCRQSHTACKDSEGKSFLSSSSSDGSLGCGCLSLVSSSVSHGLLLRDCAFSLLSLTGILTMQFRANYLIQDDFLILRSSTELHQQRSFFQGHIHRFQGLRHGNIFSGATIALM